MSSLRALRRCSPLRCGIFGLLALLLPAWALGADVKKPFDIPAAEAAVALKDFSKQAGAQVVFPSADVKGIQTRALHGSYTVREGLDALLTDTGLVASFDDKTSTFAVTRGRAAAAPGAPDPNAPSRRAERTAAEEAGGKIKDGLVQLDTFEVFASKLINADLPRSRDDVQPYVVFDREQLQMSNAVNLEDFFRTRLPMNNTVAEVPAAQYSPLNFSQIGLRGLSPQQTLILIDGRRAPPRPSSDMGGQADINGIPLSMIERVEILPSTSSGIYGGSATGGVINIITRRDFSGVELGLTYANTFETDAAQRRIDLNGSFSLEGGKTLLTLSAGYSDGTALQVRDRDIWRRSREKQLANNPAAFYGVALPPLGYTSNIVSLGGANLVLLPQYGGTNLGSSFTYVPVGYAGVAASGAAPLVANAGKYNLELPDAPSNGSQTGLFNSPEVRNLTLGARRRFTANLEAFVDLSAQENRSSLPISLPASFNLLPFGAPNNPFANTIFVSWPATHLAEPYSMVSRSRRATAGLTARLPHEWNAGVEYSWTKSWLDSVFPAPIVGDPDGTGPLPSFSTAISFGMLDVLRDLNVYPLNYAPYRLPSPFLVSAFRYQTEEWVARASGPLWDLPAGPVTLATSFSWRKETQPKTVSESNSTVPSTYLASPPLFLHAQAAYLETHVPVWAEKNSGWRRALEFQGSVRYDRSASTGLAVASSIPLAHADDPLPAIAMQERTLDKLSKTIGLKYSPVPDVTLRASWGTGFLTPTIGQLSAGIPVTTSGYILVDPKRGNVSGSTGAIQTTAGGDPNLRPELSESISAGVILTPRFLPGFRLSVDYTKIDKRDELTILGVQQLFDFEDFVPGRITRDPLTPADQALGYTGGKVTAIKTGTLNVALKQIEAYDIQADYELKTSRAGTFLFYAIATCQQHLATQAADGAPVVETIGYTGGLRWRGNGGINWKRGPWTATWNVQYYDSYIGYGPTTTPAGIAAYVLNQGRATVPSRMFHDVTVGYSFIGAGVGWRRYLNGTRLLVGVQDVFNRGPFVLASTSVIGDRSGYGDPRMARYTISVRRSF